MENMMPIPEKTKNTLLSMPIAWNEATFKKDAKYNIHGNIVGTVKYDMYGIFFQDEVKFHLCRGRYSQKYSIRVGKQRCVHGTSLDSLKRNFELRYENELLNGIIELIYNNIGTIV
jgi:hypothetical protein